MEAKFKLRNRLLLVTLLLLIFLVPQKFNPSFRVVAAESSIELGMSCDGNTMAECGEVAEEFSMESEAAQRVLAGANKYITPGALKGDLPACGSTARGTPYSKSCLGQPSNKYTRGCTSIYRCRG